MYYIDTKLNYSGCVYPTQIGAIKHVHKRFFFPSKDNGSRFLLTNIIMTKSTDEERGI